MCLELLSWVVDNSPTLFDTKNSMFLFILGCPNIITEIFVSLSLLPWCVYVCEGLM
jgi:hypothetical protein